MSSTGFRGNQFDIQEGSGKDESRVVKSATQATPSVQDFQMPNIKGRVRSSVPAMPAIPKKLDGGRVRDSRFQISELAREALSISDDEEQEIETRVKERLAAEAEQVRETAQKMGYEEGLKKGHDEAFTQFKAAAEEKVQAIETMTRELDGMKAAVFEANQKFLVDLVYRISRMILLKELSTDREYVLRLCKELIEKIGLRENLTIRVSAEDATMIEELRAGLIASLGTLRNLTIESSPEVHRGGVILESEWGKIDASIDTQLESVREALK